MGYSKPLSAEEREAHKADGFRPVEIWVPDMDDPDVLSRWREGARQAAQADKRDGTNDFLDGVLEDLLAGDD